MTAIYPYQTKEVRDLAWACFSPPLMLMEKLADPDSGISDCRFELTTARRAWLETLDRDASALLAQLAEKPSHRLGIYFEQLWQFFLRQDPEVDLLASNLPVHDRNSTLGEFDCIYFCRRRQRYVHLELAVKYFLGAHNSAPRGRDSDACAWLGPDTRDRLDKKIGHILHRQILLGDHPVARQRLIECGAEVPLKEIAFKGQLFQPWGAPLEPPRGYNGQHRFGQWLQRDQLAAYLASSGHEVFEILPKMRWLASAPAVGAGNSLTREQLNSDIKRHFEHDQYPLLVAALDSNGQQSSRFFVTGRNWPGRSRDVLADSSANRTPTDNTLG